MKSVGIENVLGSAWPFGPWALDPVQVEPSYGWVRI